MEKEDREKRRNQFRLQKKSLSNGNKKDRRNQSPVFFVITN